MALLAGTALIAAACGSDDDSGSGDTTAATEAPATEAPSSEAPAGSDAPTTGGEAPAGGMTVTYNLNPDAVWDDGTPITSADLECTYKASLNTPGSIRTAGYDVIASVDASDPATFVVTFEQPYAAYKSLWSDNGIIKADAVANCDDISGDFQDMIPFSGQPWKMESWSPDQLVLVPNESYWVEEDKPVATRAVMVPKADSDTEINSLKSGEVGMIFPQAFAGITDALNDPNIKFTPGYGTNYEDLWLQQATGPFADPIFRKAFAKSVDRELILKSIYDPIFPGSELLNCGLWVPTVGPWCDNTQFADFYDPAGAEALLTENGWAKGADGYWAKDGTVPTIRWTINTGNKRREDTQALMLPILQPGRLQGRRGQHGRRHAVPEAAPRAGLRPRHVHPDGCAGSHGDQHHALRPGPLGREQQPGQQHHRLVQRGGLGAHDPVGPGGRRDRSGRSDPPDRSGDGRRRSGAAAVPVPEHRGLAHRSAQWADRRGRRELPQRLQQPQQVGAGRRRHPHRRRAVARLPQPGD